MRTRLNLESLIIQSQFKRRLHDTSHDLSIEIGMFLSAFNQVRFLSTALNQVQFLSTALNQVRFLSTVLIQVRF